MKAGILSLVLHSVQGPVDIERKHTHRRQHQNKNTYTNENNSQENTKITMSKQMELK